MMIGLVVVGVLLLGGYALLSNKGASSQTQTIPTQAPPVTQKAVATTPTNSPVAGNVKEFTVAAKKFEFSPASITV